MKTLKLLFLFFVVSSIQLTAQQMEVLYTLDYKATAITPSNGYHACIAENETTNDGIFDIYDQNGNFIAFKNFLKGNFTSEPSVNMYDAWVISTDNSLSSGSIDADTNGHWSALRKYATSPNPDFEKIAYNAGCIPFLVDETYYGAFYVYQNNDMMSSGWNFPYTGSVIEWFIAPINADLSLGNWIKPLTDLHTNAGSIENIQATPDGHLMVSIVGDFSPPPDRSSLAIKVDSNTGTVLGELAPAGYAGPWDFHKYDYTTGDLYTYHHTIWSLFRYDSNGVLINITDWPAYPSRLLGNNLTSIHFTDNEVVGINLFEYGQTTRLSKDLILGYTTPSFEFNGNFIINSGWVQNDGKHILPTAYTGDGMQIGATTLPNISNWNTVVCRMFTPEDLSLRGILNDEDENIVAAFDHQIYNGTNWVDGYYQSTLVFKDGTAPDVDDQVDENWVIPANGMDIYIVSDEIEEITRNGETFKRFVVWYKKTGASGVQLVENALDVIIKEAEEVGIGVEENILSLKTKLYPNPAKDFVQLEIPVNEATVEVYNTLGQLSNCYQWKKTKNILDISTLKSETYFLKIITDKGTASKKFIKE